MLKICKSHIPCRRISAKKHLSLLARKNGGEDLKTTSGKM